MGAQAAKGEEAFFYLQILDSVPAGVMVFDRHSCLSVCNPAAVELLQLATDRVLQQPAGEVLRDFPDLLAIYRRTLAEGRRLAAEAELDLKGRKILLSCSSEIAPDEQDRVFAVGLIFADVTDSRRNKIFSQQQERLALIGQMAAGMAHEIKNPLTTIRGFVQLLQAKSGGQGGAENMLQLMLEEIDRATAAIRGFLQLAKPMPTKLVAMCPNLLVQEVACVVEPQAFLDRVKVSLRLHPDLPQCLLDPTQIKQVLLNLVQNALEAMPGGGELCLATAGQEEMITIRVSDTGIGMNAEELGKLGVPFFSTKDKGTGLGLSSSFAIINAHGGRIEVSSEKGRGSIFAVFLPALKEEPS